MINKWIKYYPNQTGCYLFFGWAWHKDVEPTMHVVRVVMSGSDKLIYICDGLIIRPEMVKGLWLLHELPPRPTKELMAASVPIPEEAYQWRDSTWLPVQFGPESVYFEDGDFFAIARFNDGNDIAELMWNPEEDRWEFDE